MFIYIDITENTCGHLHNVFQGKLPYLVSAILMLIYIYVTENIHVRICRTAEMMTRGIYRHPEFWPQPNRMVVLKFE